MEVRRDPRQFLFLIILFLLINSPEPQSANYNTRSRYDEVIEREWGHLEILNRTRWGDFDAQKDKWLNVTGLRDEDGFSWELLGDVRKRATEQMRGALGERADGILEGAQGADSGIPVYRNLTGYVQGEWVRSHLSRIRHPADMNISAVLPENPFPLAEFDRNVTGSSGPVRVHFTELEGRARTGANGSVSEVSARVVIGDDKSWGHNWWEFVVYGVHYPAAGAVVLTTTSERFAGIFAMPHLQLSSHFYSIAQELLNRTIYDTIERQANRVYPVWNPWSSAVEGANDALLGAAHCEFVLFLQEHPLQFQGRLPQQSLQSHVDMDWLEHELRFPTGAPLPRRSPLTMSMAGFSPDCGLVIESKGPPEFSPSEATHLVGSKTEEFNDRARHGIMAFAVTLAFHLMFLIKQAKEAATPSTRNRISFYTIAMMAVGDGFAFLALVFMHLFLGTSQLALYTIAFLAFFSIILELRFLMDIWTVQATEQMRQDRQQASTPTPPSPQAPAAQQAPPPPSSGGDTLPLPATAPRPTIIVPSDQDGVADGTTTATQDNTPGRADLGTLYSRYCLLLLVVFFLTLQFTTVRSTARAFYFNTICFIYLSFWAPQIYRNIMRNCRKALRWDFVIGQSVVRLLPIAYFYAVKDNVLFSRTDWTALAVLVGWVWLQIVALASQEVLGSRFFIREGWAPPAYDYHPILREDEEGATMPVGSSTSITGPDPESPSAPSTLQPGESKGKGKKVFDCSICATDVEVPVIPVDGGEESQGLGMGGMVVARRAYMVTPCRHIFHTGCLEGWMRYRLVCPNCREVLPPL